MFWCESAKSKKMNFCFPGASARETWRISNPFRQHLEAFKDECSCRGAATWGCAGGRLPAWARQVCPKNTLESGWHIFLKMASASFKMGWTKILFFFWILTLQREKRNPVQGFATMPGTEAKLLHFCQQGALLCRFSGQGFAQDVAERLLRVTGWC